jgi:hypothetical protein
MVKPWDETMKQLIDASPQQSAYGRRNRAEQAWLERVIQDMYDIIEQPPLYQWATRVRPTQ